MPSRQTKAASEPKTGTINPARPTRLKRFASVLLVPVITLTLTATEPAMIFIPGGDFLRGRTHALPDDNRKWFPTLLKDDRPVRSIVLDPFYIDKHEVTNAQFSEFLRDTGGAPPYYWPQGKPESAKQQHPVVNITWQDANAYCQWGGKRLPTEAEWERAARGLREGLKYPWGEDEPTKELAHYDDMDGPGAVCQFPENTFGLCDMSGNVWEWCADWYEKDYYARSPEENPTGPEKGIYRVLRGGSWADAPKYLTTAYRSYARPDEQSPTIGFRCAKRFGTAKEGRRQ